MYSSILPRAECLERNKRLCPSRELRRGIEIPGKVRYGPEEKLGRNFLHPTGSDMTGGTGVLRTEAVKRCSGELLRNENDGYLARMLWKYSYYTSLAKRVFHGTE